MISEAIQKVRQTPPHAFGSGSTAKFVRIDEVWEFKFYHDNTDRDNCHFLQKKAYKNEIAPRVGEKVDFTLGGHPRYGYITELAIIPYDEFLKLHNVEDSEDNEYVSRLYSVMEGELYNQPAYSDLMDKMEELNMSVIDMHPGNVGWMPDGRLVCIDFDNC